MKKITLLLITVVLFSCSKKDTISKDIIKLDLTSKSLNFKDKYQIQASSRSKIKYTVRDSYHAQVSDSGMVTARYVGETSILLKNSEDQDSIKIVVEPKYNIYKVPDLKFGDSKTSLIAKLGSNYKNSSTSSSILYPKYSGTTELFLSFDEENNLNSYSFVISSLYTATYLDGFFSERYNYLGNIGNDTHGKFIFVNGLDKNTAKISIDFELLNSEYWVAIYIKNPLVSKSLMISEVRPYINNVIGKVADLKTELENMKK